MSNGTGIDDCDWETDCPQSKDKQHCDCWYDGKKCCYCKDPAVPFNEDKKSKSEAPRYITPGER